MNPSDDETGAGSALKPALVGAFGLVAMLAGAIGAEVNALGINIGVTDRHGPRLGAVVVGALALSVGLVWAWPAVKTARFPSWSPIAGIGLIAIVALLLSMIIISDDPDDETLPRVPLVEELNELGATRVLDDAGIRFRVIPVASEDPVGLVLDQDPDSGTRADFVVLTISAGLDTVVPDVIGQAQADAERDLTNLGIKVATVDIDSEDPMGIVVDVVPPPGDTAEGVVLFISSGVQLPAMRDVVGRPEGEAVALLEGAGILALTTDQESSRPIGQVIDQIPDEGTPTLDAQLFVSAGPGPPVIPNVEGRQLEQAVEILEELGIQVSTQNETKRDSPRGTVFAQDPADGERSTQIALTVSSGPGTSGFAGSWTNVDVNTPGRLTRLDIAAKTSTEVDISGFEDCSPLDCGWGTTVGTLSEGVISAGFSFGFKTNSLTIERAGPLLFVVVVDDYAGTGSNQTSQYVLAQVAAERLTPADLTVLANFDVFDQIISTGVTEFLPDLVELVPQQGLISLP